jgi:hypothetical protein
MAHPYRREELVRIAEILGSDNLLQDCPAHPGNRGSLLKLLNAVPAHHERIAAAMDRNDTIQVVELTAVLRLEAEHEGCKPVARLCSRLESFAQARGPANGRSVLDEILIMALHLRYAVRRVGQA